MRVCRGTAQESLHKSTTLGVFSLYVPRVRVSRCCCSSAAAAAALFSLSLFGERACTLLRLSLLSRPAATLHRTRIYDDGTEDYIYIFSLHTPATAATAHAVSVFLSLSRYGVTTLRRTSLGDHSRTTAAPDDEEARARADNAAPRRKRRTDGCVQGGRAVLRWVGGERGERLLLAGMRYIYIYDENDDDDGGDTRRSVMAIYMCVCVREST